MKQSTNDIEKPLSNRRRRFWVFEVIERVRKAANYPWSLRLKEILRLWLPWIKRRYRITPDIEEKVLSISLSTINRALREKKIKLKRRLYGRRKSDTLLRHKISVKTDTWDVECPGFLEADLVSHSGESSYGEFIFSFNLTDIFSSWVETRAVMGRGQTGVLRALEKVPEKLPFNVLGIDSDNGSEIINYHLLHWCEKKEIQFTRSRPYKKDEATLDGLAPAEKETLESIA